MGNSNKPKAARGKPSSYTPEMGERICAELADGKSLRAVCRAPGMPGEATVRAWVMDDVGGFAAHYARARDLGVDAMADEILDISADGSGDKGADGKVDNENVQRSRLRVDTLKWYVSKLAPKRYGDRVTNEIVGANGQPLIPARDPEQEVMALLDYLRTIRARGERPLAITAVDVPSEPVST